MHRQQHPDPEQLDQLRAGLLDDQADVKAALESHVEQCPSCQSLLNNWQQLGPAALGPQLEPESLDHSLQQARQQALRTPDARPSRTFMPFATAALLLIAVSIGFWIAEPEHKETTLATTDQGQDVPGLYEDIDFYLWLAGENGNSINREESNPNST
jgi:hypothetical protein